MSKKNKDSIGGIRRAVDNIPGVYHPPHMLTAKSQRERHLPVILSKPPAWAISSRQAAASASSGTTAGWRKSN